RRPPTTRSGPRASGRPGRSARRRPCRTRSSTRSRTSVCGTSTCPPPRSGYGMRCGRHPAPSLRDRANRAACSAAPLDAGGARAEYAAVEVDVDLDSGVAIRRRVHAAAEGGEPPLVRAALPRVAHEVVGAVLGLTDPFARRLARRVVGREHVPATWCRPAQPGAGNAVVPGPAP